MKQIFNKLFFGIIFLLGLILVPQYKTSATMLALNGGGGGGGGGGTVITPTTGGTVTTNEISLTVGLDHTTTSPYTGSKNMVLTSSASVNVCSNTSFNLRLSADISGPLTKNVGNIFDQGAVGGQVIARTTNIVAPTVSGSYNLNLTAERYDPSGTGLKDDAGQIVISGYDVDITTSTGGRYLVTTNYRGRVTKLITYNSGADVTSSAQFILTNYNFTLTSTSYVYTAFSMGEASVKTYTSSIPFSVGAPSVMVTKTSVAAIPSGSTDTIKWTSTYANNCKVCKIDNANTGVDCPGFPGGTSGQFSTTQLTSTTKYYIKCDNLP